MEDSSSKFLTDPVEPRLVSRFLGLAEVCRTGGGLISLHRRQHNELEPECTDQRGAAGRQDKLNTKTAISCKT